MTGPLTVLFLCTGNSARSQMAEGLVNQDFAGEVTAESAGLEPAGLNPLAVRAMAEIGIDIGGQRSKHLSEFEGRSFDYVITLCDDADAGCPAFAGATRRLHMGFPDPARAVGADEEKLAVFRRVRDDLRRSLADYLSAELLEQGQA